MNAPLSDGEMDVLVTVAERSIWEVVARLRPWRPNVERYAPALRALGGAFVSLHRHGQLAGCLGVLSAASPLVATVAERAGAAALHDPRFRPVDQAGLPDVDVEVSVLTTSVPVPADGYAALLTDIRPGVDGITVEAGRHRATMLPSVWNELAAPDDFLAAVWRKAGLAPGEWPAGIEVHRYGAQTFGHAGRGVHRPAERPAIMDI